MYMCQGQWNRGLGIYPPAVTVGSKRLVIIHTLRDVVTICYLKFSSSPQNKLHLPSLTCTHKGEGAGGHTL